jgi:hypothetical protein
MILSPEEEDLQAEAEHLVDGERKGGLLSGIVFHAANNLLTLSVLLLRSSTI